MACTFSEDLFGPTELMWSNLNADFQSCRYFMIWLLSFSSNVSCLPVLWMTLPHYIYTGSHLKLLKALQGPSKCILSLNSWHRIFGPNPILFVSILIFRRDKKNLLYFSQGKNILSTCLTFIYIFDAWVTSKYELFRDILTIWTLEINIDIGKFRVITNMWKNTHLQKKIKI